METLFRQAGYTVKDFADKADVYLINTCVVTNMGQRKSRQIINRAIRSNPNALIVVAGCYAQIAPEKLEQIEGVDVIVGNQDRSKIVELVSKKLNAVKSFDKPCFEELPAGDVGGRTRGFLKIQEGCNQFCTYCIIPYARGPLRSRSLANIKEEITKLVDKGYREIVLIGIHLGCYGKEDGTKTLFNAVETALAVPGLTRLRLGSLESVEAEDALLDLMSKSDRLCHHLHLPLQSGCDKILAAMHRPYDTKKFQTLIENIRKKIPDIAITTDVIVGFPGETEKDFADTCAFVQKIGFAKMHIFPYSKREGTPAAAMPNQLTEAEKAERAEQLAKIDATMQQNFMKKMVGTEVTVLFEETAGDGYMEGLSSNYQRVKCPGGKELNNQIARVKITGMEGEFLTGEIKEIMRKE